jgi:hypothetical protein
MGGNAVRDDALNVQRVEIAIGCARFSSQLFGGAGPRDVNDAAGGIASKNGPLWSAQHLDAVNIDCLQQTSRTLTEIDIVENDADRGIDRFLDVSDADATDVHCGDAAWALLSVVNDNVR